MLTRIRSREYIKAFHLKEFIKNPRGQKIFTCKWLPQNKEPKALIFLCHGYAMECSISMKGKTATYSNKCLSYLSYSFAGSRLLMAFELLCHPDTGTRLAKAGYAVHGMDYEGHGKSSGLQGYIPRFKNLIDDCSEHFVAVCERHQNKKKARFLLGESMGGAVAILLHRRNPYY
ncbi:unnamed protein product [Musa textilis]